MPYLSEDKIASIVERVVSRLNAGESQTPVRSSAGPASVNPPYGCGPTGSPSASTAQSSRAGGSTPVTRGGGAGQRGVFADVDGAVAAATSAFQQLQHLGLNKRYDIIAEMRREMHTHVQYLAEAAHEETGLGRVDQKVIKNRLVIDKTPGPEVLEPWAQSGDDGLTIEEFAPYGVMGAITPTTNPTETVICNGLGMVAAGNAVVFNAHPGAKKISAFTVARLNDAIVRAGGPENLIACVGEPTIESAQGVMQHPGTRVLVVTGGPGVVKAAMNAGKKVIAGGPGNPPCVVDETADLDQAGEGIVRGVSLDNNIVCTAEKEILVVDQVAEGLKTALKRHGAYEMSRDEAQRMEKLIIDDGHVNKDWVGKNATAMLREIGVTAPANTLMTFAEVAEDHPFVQLELLTPVTGMVRYRNCTDAIDAAIRCEHGYGHTAAMYSRNIQNLHDMARRINTSIFTKNAPTFAGLGLGGEGYTSFTIASPTGEGLTTARDFSRVRRCTLKEYFRIV